MSDQGRSQGPNAVDSAYGETIARLVERGEKRDAGAGAGERIEDRMRGGRREQHGQDPDRFTRDERLAPEHEGRAGGSRNGREGE